VTPAPGTRLAVEGTLNLRDVGGYPTADGRVVRRGRLFRSDHLNGVTDDGLRALDALGLRTVLDLRVPHERERQPSRLPDGVDVHHVNPFTGGSALTDVLEDIRAGRVTSVTEDDVADGYRTMLADAGVMFASVVLVAGQADRLPALFHCTAGKDRTGIAAAIVHRLLGVADDVIATDFELTNQYRSPVRIAQIRPELEALGLDVEDFRPAFSAPVSALRAALDWLDAAGGVEAYLTDACGLATTDLDAARAAMLVPSA
jgi:protein-tyrosine phosphatase